MGTSVAMLLGHACATRPKRDPDQAQIRYQLALSYYRSRRVEPAIEEAQHALEVDPDSSDAHHLLGLIALGQGHDYLRQAETVSCLKGNEAAVVRGDAMRKFRDAQQRFEKAVALRPDFSEAWNNLAVTALQVQDWDLAVSAAQNALKNVTYAEPETARANLGWAFFQKQQVEAAWKELHEASARSPGFCVGRYRLAKVYMERGEVDRAAEEIDAVLAANSCPIQEAYVLGGLVAERRGDRERARARFKSCVDLAPRSCVADECRRYAGMVQ